MAHNTHIRKLSFKIKSLLLNGKTFITFRKTFILVLSIINNYVFNVYFIKGGFKGSMLLNRDV